MNVITDGVRNANDITFSGIPASSNSLTENTMLNFTCTADANPPRNIAIWTREPQKIAESTGQTELTKQLVMTKEHNRVGLFCVATGTDPVYDFSTGDKTYLVLCK